MRWINKQNYRGYGNQLHNKTLTIFPLDSSLDDPLDGNLWRKKRDEKETLLQTFIRIGYNNNDYHTYNNEIRAFIGAELYWLRVHSDYNNRR